MKGTDSANNQLEETAQHIFSIEGAALAAGAALGFMASKALVNAVDSAASFEEAMVEVEKVTDRSTTNIRNLSASLRQMAPGLGQTQDDLAEVAAMAGRMGFQGAENIAKFTEQVSKMAVATNLATDEAARGFAKLVRQTDATEGEIRNIGAVVNVLSNNMATSSDEIVEAATKGGAVLTQLGLRAEDILALNASVAAISDSARRAGSRLRRLGQELMDPRRIEELSNTFGMTVDQFRRLRDESPVKLILSFAKAMREGGDAAEKLNEILSTQSAQSLSIMGANLENTQEALEISNEEMEVATSLSEEFQKANETLNFHLKQTNSLMNELSVSTGQGTNPAVLGLVESLNDLLRFLGGVNRATNGAVGVFAALAGVIGAAMIATKAMITLFAQGSVSLGGITLAANTAALALGGLLTAVTLLALAWGTNFADIRDTTSSKMAEVVEIVNRSLNIMTGRMEEETGKQNSALEKLIESLESWAASFIDFVGTALVNIFDIAATEISILINSIVGVGEVIDRVRKGQIQKAREELNEARDLAQKARREKEKRTARRRARLRGRTRERLEVAGAAPSRPSRLSERLLGLHDKQADTSRAQQKTNVALEGLSSQQKKWLSKIQNGVALTEENTAQTARNTKDTANLKDILRVIAVRTGQFPKERQIKRAVSDGTLDVTELTRLFGVDATRRDVISALRTIAQKPGMELTNEELQKIVSDNRITANELRKWLPQIALNTNRTSSTLGESEVIQGDACDLRDFLLGPFERVSRQRGGRDDQARLPGDPMDVTVTNTPVLDLMKARSPTEFIKATKDIVNDALTGQLPPGVGMERTQPPVPGEPSQSITDSLPRSAAAIIGRRRGPTGGRFLTKQERENAVKTGAKEGVIEGLTRLEARDITLEADGKKLAETTDSAKDRFLNSRSIHGL